jgi:hypothetical protein
MCGLSSRYPTPNGAPGQEVSPMLTGVDLMVLQQANQTKTFSFDPVHLVLLRRVLHRERLDL